MKKLKVEDIKVKSTHKAVSYLGQGSNLASGRKEGLNKLYLALKDNPYLSDEDRELLEIDPCFKPFNVKGFFQGTAASERIMKSITSLTYIKEGDFKGDAGDYLSSYTGISRDTVPESVMFKTFKNGDIFTRPFNSYTDGPYQCTPVDLLHDYGKTLSTLVQENPAEEFLATNYLAAKNRLKGYLEHKKKSYQDFSTAMISLSEAALSDEILSVIAFRDENNSVYFVEFWDWYNTFFGVNPIEEPSEDNYSYLDKYINQRVPFERDGATERGILLNYDQHKAFLISAYSTAYPDVKDAKPNEIEDILEKKQESFTILCIPIEKLKVPRKKQITMEEIAVLFAVDPKEIEITNYGEYNNTTN